MSWDGTFAVRFAGHWFVRGSRRAGLVLGIAALALVTGNRNLQTAVAEGDTRTISFHHVHTGEDITVTYKRGGRYDEAALKKLDWFMRDWRKDEEVDMDPHLFDLLWEVNREVGGKQAIQVICGYRSPGTNAMLRARSSGVAQYSLHSKGDAVDFFIPGVPLEKVREVGLRLQRGGVGFYPTSGSPFIHIDTGSIRHWPRLARAQLLRVFPDGQTVHVPSDGVPLPGYAKALAQVESRGHLPSALSLAQARDAGVITQQQEQVAERAVEKPSQRAALAVFDFGSRGESANERLAAAERDRSTPTRRPTTIAGLSAPAGVTPTIFVPPLPKGRPVAETFVAMAVPTPHPRPAVTVDVAAADPAMTASMGQALAYAVDQPPHAAPEPPRSPPMGTAAIMTDPGQPDSRRATFAERFSAAPILIAYRSDDPWLRAAVLAPSAREYLTTLRTGHIDTRGLTAFMRKPASPVVMMSFSPDPLGGLRDDAFSGPAVVFLATLTPRTQTAWLER